MRKLLQSSKERWLAANPLPVTVTLWGHPDSAGQRKAWLLQADRAVLHPPVPWSDPGRTAESWPRLGGRQAARTSLSLPGVESTKTQVSLRLGRWLYKYSHLPPHLSFPEVHRVRIKNGLTWRIRTFKSIITYAVSSKTT